MLAYNAALPRETAADAQAEKWLSWAKANAAIYGDELQALANWLPIDIDAIVKRVVKQVLENVR